MLNYKRERTLVEELFILSQLHFVALTSSVGFSKDLVKTINDKMEELAKNHSSKPIQKLGKRIAGINQVAGVKDLVVAGKVGVLSIVKNLIKLISESGYKFPDYITEICKPFFDIERDSTVENDEEWNKIVEESKTRAFVVLSKLNNLGYFK